MASPRVLFYGLMPQMRGRYLVWGAAVTCLFAGVDLGAILLHLLISASAGLTIILVLIIYSHDPGWWPTLSTILNGAHPDSAWLTLGVAAVTLYLACTRTPTASLSHIKAGAGDPLPGAQQAVGGLSTPHERGFVGCDRESPCHWQYPTTMANLNSVLNDRINRVARKQIRGELKSLRRLTAQHRRDLANLKRLVVSMQKVLAFLERQEKRRVAVQPVAETEGVRFRADGLRSHRKRLGLSAGDYGRLVGASGLSVYHWEAGKSRPRAEFVAKLAAVRGLGKREVQKRLELLG